MIETNKIFLLHQIAAAIHGAQFLVTFVLCFANEGIRQFSRDLRVSHVAVDSNATIVADIAYKVVWPNFRVCFLVPAYFIITAASHAYVGWSIDRIENVLDTMAKIRWREYAVTATIMIVANAVLSGIWELSTLIIISALNVLMIRTGPEMDVNTKGQYEGTRIDWSPFIRGSIYGVLVWIPIWSAVAAASSGVPAVALAAISTYFILFNSFAVNAFYRYSRPDRENISECVYVILSLTSKSLLGWLIIGGTLQDA